MKTTEVAIENGLTTNLRGHDAECDLRDQLGGRKGCIHQGGGSYCTHCSGHSHLCPDSRDYKNSEIEVLRMQLAACGAVANANTRASAQRAREMHPDFHSASCNDVARAVDREMDLRDKLSEAKYGIAALRSALVGLVGASEPDELAQLAIGIRMVPAPDGSAEAAALNAIQALLDTANEKMLEVDVCP